MLYYSSVHIKKDYHTRKEEKNKKYICTLLLSLSFLITECQSDFGVDQAGMETWIETRSTTALDSDELSQNSIDFLLREGLFDNYRNQPKKHSCSKAALN